MLFHTIPAQQRKIDTRFASFMLIEPYGYAYVQAGIFTWHMPQSDHQRHLNRAIENATFIKQQRL